MYLKPLPKWIVASKIPAFYETEGATAIQMVAKLYGSVNEIISAYNSFVTDINTSINDHDIAVDERCDKFESEVSEAVKHFMQVVNCRLAKQDRKIAEAIENLNKELDEGLADLNNRLDEGLESLQQYVTNEVENLIQNITDNLYQYTEQIINGMIASGELNVVLDLEYNEEEEALSFIGKVAMPGETVTISSDEVRASIIENLVINSVSDKNVGAGELTASIVTE